MSFSFQDSTARTAWGSATSQTGQLEAFVALWAGDVPVRYYTSGGTHLGTATHSGWDAIDTGTTPYSVTLAGRPAWSHLADGTAAYCIVAVPGGADIIRSDVSLAAAVSASTGIVNLDNAAGAAGLRINATASLPAQSWLGGADLFEWIEISGTTHAGSAGDPTNDGRSNARLAFCNLALAGSELILAATGGHSDYFGNEVTGIDVADNAPAWVLRKARTELANVTLDTDPSWDGYNADGTPSSRHTYNSVHYSATHSRLVLHRTRFSYPSADSDNATNGFNLANNTWDAENTFADGETAWCMDGSGNCWTISAAYLKKWTASTDTWANVSSVAGYNAGNGEGPLCYDSTGDRLVLFKLGDGLGYGGTDVVCETFALDGTQTNISMSAGSAAAVAQFQADLGTYAVLEHDPENNVFWYWSAMSATNGVARLYKLTPNGTTTWDLAVQTVTGTDPANLGPDSGGAGGNRVGAHGRMRYVPAIKALVFMTAGTENLFAVRTA